MQPIHWMMLFGIGAAVIIGPMVARTTEERQKIYGGALPRLLNLLVCMIIASVPFTVVTGLIVRQFNIFQALLWSFSAFGIGLVLMLIFGAIEGPAREKNKDERGITNTWTEQDARTSGL